VKPETSEAVMAVKAALEPSSTVPIPPVLGVLVDSRFFQKEPREAEGEDRTGSMSCYVDEISLSYRRDKQDKQSKS
jgi:hypothetical protein